MKAAKYALMIPVCPKCDTGLFIARLGGVEIDYCERCRGVWLDAGELEQLAGDAMPAIRQATGMIPPGRKHLCPRCDASMEEITTPGGLTLDKCPRGHGLWFDADELPQLVATAHGAPLAGFFNLGGN